MLVFEGVSSGLLDDSDVTEAGAALEAGTSAGILLYENRWAAPFVDALRERGAELVAAGYIPVADIAESLRETELAGS